MVESVNKPHFYGFKSTLCLVPYIKSLINIKYTMLLSPREKMITYKFPKKKKKRAYKYEWVTIKVPSKLLYSV